MDVRLFNQNIWNGKTGNRNNLIAGLIRKYDADICNFQECHFETSRAGNTAIQKLLEPEYAEACEKYSEKNFTPVFYKKDRFEEVDSGYVVFEGLNDLASKSITWVVLSEKATGKKVAVASTHFWWKYDSKEDDMQRVENARCVKAVCDFVEKKYNIPVIVSGDLNCGRNSKQGPEGYDEMIKLGMRDIRHMAKETTDCHTHHAYPILNNEGIFEKGTMPVKTLDHAFTYGKLSVEFNSFKVLTEQDALDSSDHCPIIIDYTV